MPDLSCAMNPRMESRVETTKPQGIGVKARKFDDGDVVIVHRRLLPEEESSWNNCWTDEMDAAIGMAGTVSYQSGLKDYCLVFREDHLLDGYYYPESCLKKVS
jgi:hypothetical protein